MTKYRNPAIVFGGGINGLGLVRNLGRNGVEVLCVVDRDDIAVHSKYCKGHFVVPGIQEEKKVVSSFLKGLERKMSDYAVVFSTTDLFSLHLSDLKDELEGSYRVLLASGEVVRTLVNKRRFYESLSDRGIPCPGTFLPGSTEGIERISKEMKYPIFIKPSISQIFTRVFRKKGFIANSAEELRSYLHLLAKYNIDTIFQEVIPGPARNLYGIAGYFDRRSVPKAFFAYRRLREWPPMFGTSSLMESVPVSEVSSLKQTTEGYLHELGYHGMMEAEYKRDPRDGVFKLLEINARSWWQNSLPTKCGINIPFISYLDAISEETVYTEEYEAGIKWIHFLNDLRSAIKTCGRMSTAEWISSLCNIRDCALFSADDLVPWMTFPVLEFLRRL